MQPNNNRPLYIVQPSTVTQLGVRSPIVTTTGPQVPVQSQPVYQISTVRQTTATQQTTPLYQVTGQPRGISSPPVYTLQSQQFVPSPRQILTPNSNISPRLITPQAIPRTTLVTALPTTNTIIRPGITTVSTSPKVTSTPTSTTTATAAATAPQSSSSSSSSKDICVKALRSTLQYGIMEFATGLSIDIKDWKSAEMRREIDPYTYRPPTNLDPSAGSSTSITTSMGVVMPKTGAGSEYGREQKEALKRKRFATKGTNIEDLPWLLTTQSLTDKKQRHYRGLKKGGVTTNSSYYIFIQGKDGFEAYPVEEWYGFSPTNVYKTLDFDEAEKRYKEQHKVLSKWAEKSKVKETKDSEETNEKDEEKGAKPKSKSKRSFKLLDIEDHVNENEEDEDDDDDDNDTDVKDKSKRRSKKKDAKTSKSAWTLSDEDDNDELEKGPSKAKRKKTTERQTSENQEDSDDGDHECDEIDYTSDEVSADEEDPKDANTDQVANKYEIKGVDEEMKTIPDVEKKLEQMDDNADEIDFDDDGEELSDIDDKDEDNGKSAADDLADVGKLLKSDAISKEIDSSSDDDDLDDSDDPDKEALEQATNSISIQPVPLEQIKTEKGHKKAREEEMRAIKSKVMSLPSTPANPSETITEEKVRNLLKGKQMALSELCQKFLPKQENMRTKEIKEGIVQRLCEILKRLNYEERNINGKKYIRLKT